MSEVKHGKVSHCGRLKLTGTDKTITANRPSATGGALEKERILSGGTVLSYQNWFNDLFQPTQLTQLHSIVRMHHVPVGELEVDGRWRQQVRGN